VLSCGESARLEEGGQRTMSVAGILFTTDALARFGLKLEEMPFLIDVFFTTTVPLNKTKPKKRIPSSPSRQTREHVLHKATKSGEADRKSR
jgi:hypothetical protein